MDATSNFGYSTVATAPSPATSGTSLVLQAGDGTRFPAPPFNAVIWPSGTNPTFTNAEIVRVTGLSTDTLTISRAQEGTNARTVIVGDQIANTITVKMMNDIDTLKLDKNGAITGATKTKITYDSKGLVTAGADATTADIAASTNKNYVTDAQATVIGNTSGTNTGDQTTVSGNAGTATTLQTSRTLWGQSFNGSANVTGPPTLPAATSGAASLTITPGSLQTTPADGDIEMDANTLYATTDAGNRGFIQVSNVIRQHADRAAFANNANQQAIFDSVANGTLTIETGTYLVDALVQVKGMSATSGNLKFSLIGAGTATITNILYMAYGADTANDTLSAMSGVNEVINTQTATNMSTATTATIQMFQVKGSFECTGAGSIIPSVAQTTATTTAVTTAGSYFMTWRVGATTMTSVGQWT